MAADDGPVAGDDPGEDLRAPEIHADRIARMHSGYRNPPHGRLRGEAVSRLPRRPDEGQSAAAAARAGGPAGRPQRRRRAGQDRRAAAAPAPALVRLDVARWTLVTILGLIFLTMIWGVLGYLSVASGVSDANKRLPQSVRPALAPDSGLLFSSPTTILLLGTDHATGQGEHRPLRRSALRLDDHPPHRPGPQPPVLPLDSARPADRRARPRRAEDQRGDAVRRTEARGADGGQAPRARACRSTTS